MILLAKLVSEQMFLLVTLLLKPEAVELPIAGAWIGVGSGFMAYREQLPATLLTAIQCIDASALPQPEAMLQLAEHALAAGQARPPELVEPMYLRNQVALTIEQRKQR